MATKPNQSNVTPFPTPTKSFASRIDVEALLRDEIRGERPLAQIQQTIRFLMLGYLPNWASPRGLSHNPEASLLGWQPLENKDIPRLKVALDANLKLLNKVLPDLRSLDFTDQTPPPQMSDLELAARVASIVGHKNTSPLFIPHAPHAPHTVEAVPVHPAPDPQQLSAIVHKARRDRSPIGTLTEEDIQDPPEKEPPYPWM